MESDTISPSLEILVSLEIIPVVTQSSDHVANQDADNDESQGQDMGNVQEFRRAQRNPHKPSWLVTNMIVAYALSVIEEASPSTYKKVEISSKSKM